MGTSALAAAVLAILSIHFSSGSNVEDFRLLEDSFMQAYEGQEPVAFSGAVREERPVKRYNVPRSQPRKFVPQRQTTKRRLSPVYKPYHPAVIAPQIYPRPQYAPANRRNGFFPQPSVLFPRKINVLFAPRRNIVSFGRRNPYYTREPKLLSTPLRNAIIPANKPLFYQQPYMYKPRVPFMYRPNQYMNAQRRAYMYRNFHKQRLPYLFRQPNAYSRAAMRSFTPKFYYRQPGMAYPFAQYRPRQFVYSRDHTWNGNQLNLKMGTGSHTQSHSILKAPGHTSTETHVVNKQQSGGRVRGVAPAAKGKQAYQATNQKYPFKGFGSGARGKVSASAKVNAKASAASASNSQSSGSAKTNGGSRTTSSGGWGVGAGAGWGTGPNAWGVGYGVGGGGSNGKLPSNMVGIPGMPGKFPGIPQGFPGMPAGGFPGKGKYAGAGKPGSKAPSSTLKGKKVSLKPKKGLKEKAAFKAPAKQIQLKPKPSSVKTAKKLKNFSGQAKSAVPGKIYRVQFFTSEPMQRPVNSQWQNMRQKIISDVMRG